jgi:preprotein translocase subunit SecA
MSGSATTPTGSSRIATPVGVIDDQVVDSYKKGIKDRKIFEKIHESGVTTIAALMEVVNKLIDTGEEMVNQFDYDAKRDAGTSGTWVSPLRICPGLTS